MSSVPVIVPNILSSSANYVNNNTPAWVPGVEALATSRGFAGTASVPAVPVNATAAAVPTLYVGSASDPNIPNGSVATVYVLSNTVRNSGTPTAGASVYMTCNIIAYQSAGVPLINAYNATSTDANFYLAITGGNTLAVWSIANNTKSLQYVSVLTQTVPITSRLA